MESSLKVVRSVCAVQGIPPDEGHYSYCQEEGEIVGELAVWGLGGGRPTVEQRLGDLPPPPLSKQRPRWAPL